MENAFGEKIQVGSKVTWMGKTYFSKPKELRSGVVIEICQKFYKPSYNFSHSESPTRIDFGKVKNRIMVSPDKQKKDAYRPYPIRLSDLSNIRLEKETNEENQ